MTAAGSTARRRCSARAPALYRRAAFDDVGLFDDTYFAYPKDVDWAMRAQLAGYAARYEPAAVGYHMGAATRRRRDFYWRLQRRNQCIVKTFPASTVAPALPASRKRRS